MKNLIKILVAASCLWSVRAVHAATGDWTGNINIHLGNKELDGAVFSIPGTDTQSERGISVDFRKRGWWANLFFAHLTSDETSEFSEIIPLVGEETIKVDDKTTELRAGLRKIWRDDRVFRPFLGAGLARVSHSRSLSSTNPNTLIEGGSSNSTVGFYLEGGLGLTFADRFNLGIEVSQSFADADVAEELVIRATDHSNAVHG